MLASLVLLLGSSLAAQPAPPPEIQEALGLIQQQDWEKAGAVLDRYLDAHPDDGDAWYRLAQVRRGQERWQDSLAAVERAAEAGLANPLGIALVKAEAQAGLGRVDAAFETLEVVTAGGPNRPILARAESGSGFAALRPDPRWEEVLRQLKACTSEEYRRFDFWLGDFEVVHPVTGAFLGDNTVTLHLDGCMLMESWRGATGMHGMSMNYYDPATGTWNQIFLDNNGLPANWPALSGNLDDDGAMVLLTTPKDGNQARWTWSVVDEKTVRQKAETTADGGETWQVVWDSHYVRKE